MSVQRARQRATSARHVSAPRQCVMSARHATHQRASPGSTHTIARTTHSVCAHCSRNHRQPEQERPGWYHQDQPQEGRLRQDRLQAHTRLDKKSSLDKKSCLVFKYRVLDFLSCSSLGVIGLDLTAKAKAVPAVRPHPPRPPKGLPPRNSEKRVLVLDILIEL